MNVNELLLALVLVAVILAPALRYGQDCRAARSCRSLLAMTDKSFVISVEPAPAIFTATAPAVPPTVFERAFAELADLLARLGRR